MLTEVPMDSAFGGLISYGVGHIGSKTPNWKYLFLVEGLPGFLLGAFCLYWLPDRPLKNSRFTEKEKEIAVARYRRDSYDRVGRIQKKHVIWTLTDWKLYVQGVPDPASLVLLFVENTSLTVVQRPFTSPPQRF